MNKKNNLIKIISNEKLISNIYYKFNVNKYLKKKEFPDPISLKIIKTLSKQISTGNYKWHISRDNKNLFNFKNHIVQSLIKIILTILYEPIFQKLTDKNSFVLNKNAKILIQQLQLQNQNLTFALKGKIDTTINHEILIQILKKKVNDKKFLDLIKTGLKANILLTKETNLIFTNIYMHIFDIYISKKIKKLNLWNQLKNRNYNNSFKNSIIQIYVAKKKLSSLKLKKQTFKSFNVQTFRKFKNDLKKIKLKQTKINNTKKKKFLVSYNRYNNHWILITNCSYSKLKKLEKILVLLLKNKLKVKNKNLIINLNKKKVNYLGFTIHNKNQKIKKIIYKNGITARKKISSLLFIGINHKYMKNKLIKLKIITPQYQPKHVNLYYNSKPDYILKKFKQELEMCIKYYFNIITKPSDLNYYYYAYKFSCLKTLAVKMKKSITYISIKYKNKLSIEETNTFNPMISFPSYLKTANYINKKTKH